MPDPTTYSQSVSDYIKKTAGLTDQSAIQYVIDNSDDTNLGPGVASSTIYSNFYNTGLDPTTYASEFIMGHSDAAVDSEILPGDRYMIPIKNSNPGSNKKCFDTSGAPHELSTIVDNVQRTNVVSDPSYQGLFYSLYSSVQDFNDGITNIDLKKNPYSCKPVSNYINDTGLKSKDTYYILNSDTEGFIDTAAYVDVDVTRQKKSSPGSIGPGLVPGLAPATNNPPLLSPDGSQQKNIMGIPMYQVDGNSGGPNQYNASSPSVKANQAIMDQLFPESGGETVATGAFNNLKRMIGGTPAVSTFTTIESSDIVLQQYQNRKKNPWEDPIFIFYVGSLGLLFGFLVYRLFNAKKR